MGERCDETCSESSSAATKMSGVSLPLAEAFLLDRQALIWNAVGLYHADRILSMVTPILQVAFGIQEIS